MSTDKPKPDFSNVKSGSSPPRPGRGSAGSAEQIYTVMAGGQLSKISKKVYGTPISGSDLRGQSRPDQESDLIHPARSSRFRQT